MMTNSREEFGTYLNNFKHVTGGLKVYSELNEHEKAVARNAFDAGWKAAKSEGEKEIAELKADNLAQYEHIGYLNNRLNDENIAYETAVHGLIEVANKKESQITELQSQINTLREAVTKLWESLGRWSAYLASNGEQAELSPPSWLIDAVKNATTPQQPKSVADALKELERALCVIGVVGNVDGHDVIRRESVIDVARQSIKRNAEG